MADWITSTEATQLSGYNDQYLRKLIRLKKVVAEKKSGRFWIDRQSLLEYMQTAKESDDRRHGPWKSRS